MSVPTSMAWTAVSPEAQVEDLKRKLTKAFREEGLPPAIVSHLVNRTADILVNWDYARHQWQIHWADVHHGEMP